MENRIKEFRTKSNFSRVDLASMVDKRARDIQRFETLKRPVPFNIAKAICLALGRSMNVVFPGATAALAALKEDMTQERHPSPDTMEKLRQSGIEVDPRQYILKVLLQGHGEPFSFNIPAEEQARLFKSVQCESDDSGEVSFIVFDTDDSTVAINLRRLSFCQFPWEPSTDAFIHIKYPEENESSQDDALNRVTLFLNDDPKPRTYEAEPESNSEETNDLGDFGNIFFSLNIGCKPSDRLHFEDIDGEDAFIRAGDLALLQVPLWVLDEDERESLEEENDSDAPRS